MDKAYSYRGFEIMVKALPAMCDEGCLDDNEVFRGFVAGVTIKTNLIPYEWETAFRAGPRPGCSFARTSDVFPYGKQSATLIIDMLIDVLGVTQPVNEDVCIALL